MQPTAARRRHHGRHPRARSPRLALDAVFRGLANEQRRAIVARLARGPSTTPELGRRFGFTKQALSRHMVQLERAGLVERTLRGRVHELVLVPGRLDGVVRWIDELRAGWVASLDRLEEVLGERKE
jgi:DNA-binding transcriptional ArsR family regulator